MFLLYFKSMVWWPTQNHQDTTRQYEIHFCVIFYFGNISAGNISAVKIVVLMTLLKYIPNSQRFLTKYKNNQQKQTPCN